MTQAIVYTSQTGNTAQLAQCIRTLLPPEQVLYMGDIQPQALQAERLFVGFWTDKGDCPPEMAAFLAELTGKEVFLFGTAGFGGSPDYFTQIIRRVTAHLGPDNRLLGWYMCQGKMPQAVRTRYETLAQTQPEQAQPMLDNFDRALSHPSQEDLAELQQAVLALRT